jgi:hypothetical protein
MVKGFFFFPQPLDCLLLKVAFLMLSTTRTLALAFLESPEQDLTCLTPHWYIGAAPLLTVNVQYDPLLAAKRKSPGLFETCLSDCSLSHR